MGCATAFYLSELMSDAEPEAEEGDVSVLVVESSGEVASQASGKAGGFLASDWSTGSLGLLAQKSFELHSELADVLGAKTIGYRSVFKYKGSPSQGVPLGSGLSRHYLRIYGIAKWPAQNCI